MSMLSERLQILISSEQRRRLEDTAQQRGSSVAAVVREAIDASLGGPTREERREALEAIAAMKGRYLTPEEIEEIIAEEREANVKL
jgi:predicted transcriptional regulator